ncbi:MATH domain and coiled-coil domain-containing protein At3g44800-like isoform X2 [Papaver somniferum]|uniref:MATH domain and coiled-coil domain-containing protein At3g44800-like isoform X2 n=1 Tax=Papaver somniferum TaxID=3469 RepID=UPI000E6F4BCA|nr:MATH domain and coiled-coil domain-containing protein At3g44800-like isoform X2 [Papaver somniferum]XP_026455190.1 MATH domain and coiled-coil domain-containing protein At3g44800-like isoform X2 [Papaver somniferum]
MVLVAVVYWVFIKDSAFLWNKHFCWNSFQSPQVVTGIFLFQMESVISSLLLAVQNQHAVNEDDGPWTSSYIWRIENVSKLNEDDHFSPIFSIGPDKWRLLAFRRGCEVNGYLSVYVVAIKCKNSRNAKFNLAIVDQTYNHNSLRKDTEDQIFRFTEDESDWGFDDFIQLKELKDPRNGYIVNDACIIECIISAHDSIEDVVFESIERDSAFVCAFCQTSKVSENSGSILHFASRKEVEEDEASGPNVVHVHQKCAELAPRVYYAGEIVMNLEKELARSSKLKCSCCGLKGAALGCFKRSCKNTYHAPCALGTSDCQWDDEGHRMLCPSHSGMKFSHEKTKKEKKLVKDNSSAVQRLSMLKKEKVIAKKKKSRYSRTG